MNLENICITEITDSVGASARLTERFEHSFGVDAVRMLVKAGRLRSLLFQDGILVWREKDAVTRGKDLIFLRADLEDVPKPRRRGRPGQEA